MLIDWQVPQNDFYVNRCDVKLGTTTGPERVGAMWCDGSGLVLCGCNVVILRDGLVNRW